VIEPTNTVSPRVARFWATAGGFVFIGHERQAGEHVAQVQVRIFAMAQAGDDQRVQHRLTFTVFGVADQQPGFLANDRSLDGVSMGLFPAGLALAQGCTERLRLSK
jgi:hypothetical protein